VNAVGKPDDRNGRVRFDEGVLETERWAARGGHSPERGETAWPRTPWSPPRQHPTLLAILVDGSRRHDWLLKAVDRRLREEFAKLDLRVNEAKSRIVDLAQGEAFGFLGFDFRRIRSGRGAWRPQYTPQQKKRAGLLEKLKAVFQRYQSQPIGRVIEEINPILRGWVNYFRIGHAARCFTLVKDWVEQKVRRHMMRARKRSGFGWKRWNRAWLHSTLGLFKDYRVQYWVPA